MLEDVDLLQKITEACRLAVRAVVMNSVNAEGRVGAVVAFDRGALIQKMARVRSPMNQAFADGGFPNVPDSALVGPVKYLEFCLSQICADNELGALISALNGEFIEPGPGVDPVRNPLVFPTGKNIHALDPQSLPTSAALDSGKTVVDRLLDQHRWGTAYAGPLWRCLMRAQSKDYPPPGLDRLRQLYLDADRCVWIRSRGLTGD